jgi:hypothetical protein
MHFLRTLFLCLLCWQSAWAQVEIKEDGTVPFLCSYFGEEITFPATTYSTTDEARDIIKNILSIVGLKPNFEVYAADVPNAAAVIDKGKRFILYNPDFTTRLNKITHNNWASISILAHEVGHHLNGHTLLQTGSRPDLELEADEFSGFVLRKLGASLDDAQAAMKTASGLKASHTHPGRADRLKAIEEGWITADNQMAGKVKPPKTNSKIEKPVITRKPEVESGSILAEKYIAYDVHFDADPASNYYVTIRNHLVKVDEKNIYVAATLAKSNRKKYPAMFYDKQYNYLYITSDGSILNGAAKKVGYMKKHLN